ncbi:MAG: stimulus-sensing domain-containing protein [Alphaproteobacteria bacterium]
MLGPSSPILKRILAINMLALAILVAGLMYLGEYRKSLIASELASLAVHGEMLAAALGESAANDDVSQQLRPAIATQMVSRLVAATGGRARLFAADGVLIADSRLATGPVGSVQSMELPPPDDDTWTNFELALDAYETMMRLLPGGGAPPPYREFSRQRASDYEEVVAALSGEPRNSVRRTDGGSMVLITAVPVQRYKQVLGAVLLTRSGDAIEAVLREVRLDILKMFAVALAVTIALSLYLASTIAQPIRRLAEAAERVRHGHHRQHTIPDLGSHSDEIGELALALKDMTEALWNRMDAIESFAADVAHEIKNPLTSLRSAVETAARIKDPDQQRTLMDIILNDVQRLDRLISDISNASRLDAELSRAETAPVDLRTMLESLAETRRTVGARDIVLTVGDDVDLRLDGIESRLGQVFANLLDNAASFSPENGRIVVTATGDADAITITIDDDGPGIPDAKRQAIFERFYTERPEAEKFGLHSGLGLSISKQIIEAHEGTIHAENRLAEDGAILGARFTVRLPRG